MPIYSDTDLKVQAQLNQWQVICGIRYHGIKTIDKWTGDSFTIILNGQDFEYKTGVGCRFIGKGVNSYDAKLIKLKHKFLRAWDSSLLDMQKLTLCRSFETEVKGLFVPAPAIAGVIWSVLMEGSACDNSFNDWCADFGHDTDSRKALEIYLSCQQNGTKLRKVFTSSQLSTLQAMLEDY